MNRTLTSLAAFALALSLGGCATTDPNGQNDPYEQTNRSIFALDQTFDHAIARPMAVGYNYAVPAVARDGIHNFLTNLNSPVVFANDLLQGETTRAGHTLGRALVNSTLGLGGLVDFAGKIGIPGHEEDFGQTLAVWGADEGPYLVLPFAGPSNPRDVVGMGGDLALDPFTYMKWNNSSLHQMIRAGVGVIDLRARNIENLDQIERTSVDLYATTRSLYRQHRNAEIRNGAAANDLPDL